MANDPAVWSTIGHVLLQASAYVLAIGTLSGAVWWLALPRIKDWLHREIAAPVQDTHKSVTVNGGHNSPPTLMDKVGILAAQVEQVIAVAGANAQRSSDLSDRMDEVHELALQARDMAKESRDEMRDHERRGEQYLGKVRVVLGEQGLNLPDHRD